MTESKRDGTDYSHPLPDRHVRDAAADHEITAEQLHERLEELQAFFEEHLYSFYEEDWMGGGARHLLAEDGLGAVWFAFQPINFKFGGNGMSQTDVSELELSTDEINAITDAHGRVAADWGFTTDTPTAYNSSVKGPDFQPYLIDYPEEWRTAMRLERMRMMNLLSYDLTPAEALDYWGLSAGPGATNDEERWIAYRGVDRQAISKTRRQAQEKLNDPEKQPYHEKQFVGTKPAESKGEVDLPSASDE